MTDKDPAQMTVEELCRSFDEDILYDCHDLDIKLSRSQAGAELFRRRKAALGGIAKHLREHQGLDALQGELRLAWGKTLFWIGTRIGHALDSPAEYTDTKAWITWAERNAAD